MAGNHHRSEEDLSRSEDAREHDYLLLKMAEIIRWARKKHPHLIVVIENPVGRLQKMPIMQEFVDEVGLVKVVVDYCTFGRDEQKPTHLWTNDHNLKAKLSYYKCSDLCPFGKKGQKHLVSVQNNREFDYSAIPQPLAEEVADYVNSRFYLDNLRRTKAVPPGE